LDAAEFQEKTGMTKKRDMRIVEKIAVAFVPSFKWIFQPQMSTAICKIVERFHFFMSAPLFVTNNKQTTVNCTISTGCSRHASHPKKTIFLYSPYVNQNKIYRPSRAIFFHKS
jgi:hypothetical protein